MTTPDEMPQGGDGGEQAPTPQFDPTAAHHNKPKIRPVRGFPVRHGEQVALGLADAQQISQRIVFTTPAVQALLPHMNGEHEIDAIVAKVGRGLTREMMEQFVAQMDAAGLLFGPTFEAMLDKMREDFDSQPNLPPASTATIADMLVQQELGQEATREQMDAMGPGRLSEQFDAWIDEALENAESPSFDALPRAVVAPHLDYQRGWKNYAHVYGRMRVVDRPDRVIILGTNHFGRSTGVCGCDKGFESPLGLCALDEGFVDLLREELGLDDSLKLFAERFDHEREHSIELQIPWIQHVFGADDNGEFPKVFGALVHDPAHNNGESYDGKGLGLLPFVEALKGAIAKAGGKTLIVCSADLSHVGAQFGDPVQINNDEDENAIALREKVAQHDEEMLSLFEAGKVEEMVASMAWQQNPTRWCSVGAMTATIKALEPDSITRLHYHPAVDEAGTALVSSCAAAVF